MYLTLGARGVLFSDQNYEMITFLWLKVLGQGPLLAISNTDSSYFVWWGRCDPQYNIHMYICMYACCIHLLFQEIPLYFIFYCPQRAIQMQHKIPPKTKDRAEMSLYCNLPVIGWPVADPSLQLGKWHWLYYGGHFLLQHHCIGKQQMDCAALWQSSLV